MIRLAEQDRCALGPRADRGGRRPDRRPRSKAGPPGRFTAAGRDRGAARAGAELRGHRLAADPHALRRAAADLAVPGRRAQPRRRGRDGRRPGGGAGDRRGARAPRPASPATATCRPRRPTCCTASAGTARRRPPSWLRSSSPTTPRSASSWRDGCRSRPSEEPAQGARAPPRGWVLHQNRRPA